MVVTFEGCGTPEMIEHLTQATQLFGKNLMTERLCRNLTIDIIIRSNMREHGICTPIEFNKSNKPRGFEIELRKKKSLKSMISTLAHEMVHVKQYAVGEMNEYDNVWQGKKINIRKMDYFSLPWEQEAYSRENDLLKLYKNHFRLEKSCCLPEEKHI